MVHLYRSCWDTQALPADHLPQVVVEVLLPVVPAPLELLSASSYKLARGLDEICISKAEVLERGIDSGMNVINYGVTNRSSVQIAPER